ncbi:MAG: hypothetical protein KF852_00800 [Saprospiraceae bacterium]|nr:hypothetical protein [Saprospiraceae bacterium]
MSLGKLIIVTRCIDIRHNINKDRAMRTLSLFILLVFPVLLLSGQNLSGVWKGQLTQEGVADAFTYEVNLTQDGEALSGLAIARTADGKHTARFTLAGKINGTKATLQEIGQTEPAQPRWCLKFAQLNWTRPDGMWQLEGAWTADGCKPGRMLLQKPAQADAPGFTGIWTGHLSQSDRAYGFFYQVYIEPGGTGYSTIVSEGSGGSARHDLSWRIEPGTDMIRIQEGRVAEKTDPLWKWCIKSAALTFRREDLRMVAEGDWQGFIEGDQGGACAPGRVFLEKPILPPVVAQQSEQQSAEYATEQGRKVSVGNVIQVARPDIRIRVWDNGVVDGDIATLFLNGKRILNRHRVGKSKFSIPVKLEGDNNVLVLHAESLGSVPPNTVAVSVYDGLKEQVIVLCSNLEESGAVLIRTFRVD